MLHVIASQTLKWFNPVALLHVVSSEESHCWTSLSKSTQYSFFFPHLLVYLNVLHSPFYAVASVMQSTAWGRGRLCVTVWEKKNSWSFVWRTRLLFFCIRTIHTLDSKNNCGTKHKKSEVCFLTVRWKKERLYELERKPAQSLEIHIKRTSSGKRTPVTAASVNSKWKLPRAATWYGNSFTLRSACICEIMWSYKYLAPVFQQLRGLDVNTSESNDCLLESNNGSSSRG